MIDNLDILDGYLDGFIGMFIINIFFINCAEIVDF